MCEALRRLMKDEITQELEAAQRKTKQKMTLSLFGMGMSIEKIAEAAEGIADGSAVVECRFAAWRSRGWSMGTGLSAATVQPL